MPEAVFFVILFKKTASPHGVAPVLALLANGRRDENYALRKERIGHCRIAWGGPFHAASATRLHWASLFSSTRDDPKGWESHGYARQVAAPTGTRRWRSRADARWCSSSPNGVDTALETQIARGSARSTGSDAASVIMCVGAPQNASVGTSAKQLPTGFSYL